MQKEHSSNSGGYFEPVVSHQFLPGCRNCGAPHPLARKPQMPAEVCPDCQSPAGQPGQTFTQVGVLGGKSPAILMGKLFLAIGNKLNNISKR